MKDIDIENIDGIYKSLDFSPVSRLEIALIEGVKHDILWQRLSNDAKIEKRKKEINYAKTHFKESTSKKVLEYEQKVVRLGSLIQELLEKMEFLGEFDYQAIDKSSGQATLFRLRNILYCELYSINKHRKLEFSGHVPFEEVVEPLIKELASTEYYSEFKLEALADVYRETIDLYEQKPYSRN